MYLYRIAASVLRKKTVLGTGQDCKKENLQKQKINYDNIKILHSTVINSKNNYYLNCLHLFRRKIVLGAF